MEVLHAFDGLLDDRAGVEVGGDVVAGGTDEFHAAFVRLAVRVRADEGGEEAVVDVDDAAFVGAAKIIREDLHEAGEDDQFDVFVFQDVLDFGEAGRLLVAIHVDLVKGDVGVLCDGFAGIAIADDRGDFDGEFTEFGAPEDFLKAVVGFGDEHRSAHFVGEAAEMPLGLEGAAEGAEAIDEILDLNGEATGLDFEA